MLIINACALRNLILAIAKHCQITFTLSRPLPLSPFSPAFPFFPSFPFCPFWTSCLSCASYLFSPFCPSSTCVGRCDPSQLLFLLKIKINKLQKLNTFVGKDSEASGVLDLFAFEAIRIAFCSASQILFACHNAVNVLIQILSLIVAIQIS